MNRREGQALDRYITGNYGEDSVVNEGALSDECEALLMQRDMYSEPAKFPEGCADIRDCDGERMFSVTRGIALHDLRTMLAYGEFKFQRGHSEGQKIIQHQLRKLLDVPANPKDAA